MTPEEAGKMCEDAAARLGEHFSSVQILATRPADGGGTHGVKRGVGDWYARQGMAHEFINSQISEDTASQIAAKLNPPDEGDDWKKQPDARP